ncbi:MAG: homoserine O-acetyltransferase [Planctomycetota bacterium]|nr:MAG: homoserine O-acetyltransferase [Planctomycetota bacterium]
MATDSEELRDRGEPIEPGPNSVGFVEKRSATLFVPPNPLRLAGGGELGPVTVSYETYGELSPQSDNAIFVCHALTGDAHVAGWHTPQDRKPGWWDEFVGPGKGLDTNRYFVICANVLGGCQGTTGPRSLNPQNGESYGLNFPFMTVGDMVEVHAELVRSLGITKLLSIVGGSLGGMQVLEWTARYPQMVQSAICMATAAKLTAQGIAFNAVGRRAICTDPNFHGGQYYDKPQGPSVGLALARMVAHITYLSDASIEMKFSRRLQAGDKLSYDMMRQIEFQVESYLHYQGKRFIERFDANSYLYLTRAMDYFDLAEGRGSVAQALSQTNARFLVTSYTSDWLFPTTQSKSLVRAMIEARRHVTFIELESSYGHDAFLIEVEWLERLVRPFLEQTLLAIRS